VVWPPIVRVIYSPVHFQPSIIGVVSRALIRMRVIYSAVYLCPFMVRMVETPIIGMIQPPIIRWISRYSSSIQLRSWIVGMVKWPMIGMLHLPKIIRVIYSTLIHLRP
jgi:hypothetical protein